jgi:predicted ATPase/DNA-binding CsgD family transcriptional regulator
VEHNLPAPLTSLLGRSRELAGIGEGLRRTRLVTVTGPGGVGKTRLAVELARGQIRRRANGVWLVDLSTGAEVPDVAHETARTLGLRSTSAVRATAALQGYLASRDVLLVLDNCEHVIDPAAELANAVLTTCPGVRILATSREPLGVDGETVWSLDPLGPEDAFRLFVERARQRRADFTPGVREEPTITELCERVDRLPLAIELAAARVGAMSPAEILAGLESELGELGGRRRVAPPRHRTVRAAVEWSYRLLDPTEQESLRSLAVFAGGFDPGAAAEVAPVVSHELLTRLVDKSLVAVRRDSGGPTRYRLLETVREYALERLAEAGELETVRQRHLRHFTARTGEASSGFPSIRAEEVLNRLFDDYENVRAALEWAIAAEPCAGLRLFAGARDLFILLGQADGHRLATVLLERCPNRDRYRAQAQITAGVLEMLMADREGAMASLAEARNLSAALGDDDLEGWAALLQGLTAALAGTVDRARPLLEESMEIQRRGGTRAGEAAAMAVLGLTEGNAGRRLVEEALSIQLAEGYRWGEGQAHLYLGLMADSEPERATAHFRGAVDALRGYHDATLLPVALIGQAGVLGRRDPEKALTVAAAAFAARARVGGDFAPIYRERAERVKRDAESRLGADAPRIWAAGGRLGTGDAIALAFGTAKPSSRPPSGLSARELEVAELVAQGLSNKAIASRLQLSVRTVESHVRHALTKLRLDNRTQLATWTSERTQ